MKKWIALLMVMALCGATLTPAFAEEGETYDAPAEAVDGVLPTNAAEGEPVPQEVEITLEEDEGETVTATADAPAEAPAEAPYTSGYGKVVVQEASLYQTPDAAEAFAVLAQDDMALAVGYDDASRRLCVAFNSARGIIAGYVDASAMQKLSDAEFDAYMNAVADNVEALYNGDINCPLMTLNCRFLDETPQEPTEVDNATAELTEVESDPAQPEAPTEATGEPSTDDNVENTAPTEGQASEAVTPAEAPAPETVEPVETPAETIDEPPLDDGGAYAVAAAEGAVPITDFALPGGLELGVKENFTLTPAIAPENGVASFTWSSDNPKSVTVDPSTGALTAKKKGSANITARSDNGIEHTCAVTVRKAPKSIALNESAVYLTGGGNTFQLVATLTKKTASTIYYSSSNPGVADITGSGLVVSYSPGSATITARTFNGKTATCEVRVLDPSIPQPTRVDIPAEITIGVKQSAALNPVMYAADGSAIAADYTVVSSAPKKLKVNGDGTITGVKKGNYAVKVTAWNGVSATCTVHVEKAPGKVALSPKEPVLGVGQTRQLTVSFPKGGVGTVSFFSSNEGVCVVDGAGNVTGLSEGSADITVRTHNGKTAKVTVKVTRSPAYMGLNANYNLEYNPITGAYSTMYSFSLNPGESYQLSCEVEYGAYGDVASFDSYNNDVATVNGSGVITAVAPGTAIIVARATGGSETYCRVTVNGSLPASIAFTASEANVRAGQTAALPGLKGSGIDASGLASATYASGDTGIFTVAYSAADAEWQITGVKEGSAMLTASAGGGTAQLSVTVLPAATASSEIRFADSVVYLAVGGTWKPTVYDEYGVAVAATYTSGSRDIADVDASGVLTGIAEGEAKLTATAGALTATTTVRVRKDLATVTVDPATLTLAVGKRQTLTAKVNGDSGSNVAWTSSDTSVATVSDSGVVIARGAGTATVTATSYGGGKAACEVTVRSAPTAVSITPASVTARLDEGGAQLAWAFGGQDELGSVSFTSSDQGVAVVNNEGYVAFTGVGTAVITLTTDNGLMTSIDVTVTPSKPVATTPTFRLFAAYEYFNQDFKGFLPFSANNANSVANVFANSSVSGLGYSTKVMGNPTKTALLNGISGFFSGSADVDVSIVYLCSHGHMTDGTAGYRMSLAGYDDSPNNANYFLTSQEIFNAVSRIRGNVILIIDSCYSGAFLQDMTGQLDAQGGRIAVMTAASDTRATYYNVKKIEKTVDFFTFFLLKGLGYNHRDQYWTANAAGKKGAYPGYLAADKSGNNDGLVTLGEFYDYAAKSIAANIPGYMKKSWYWGDRSRVQEPRYYAGGLNDLVIYQPK